MRAGGARRTSRRRVPSSAGRRGGGTASPRARRAARWLWGDGDESGERRVGGEGDLESTRGGEDAGAHARHMRRRTSGLCQLTLPPRPISRASSASLPPLAASHTALPIESLIAPRFFGNYSVSPATSGRARAAPRERSGGGGGAHIRRGAHAARPHAPRSSGGRGGSRAGSRARRGRPKRPRRAVEAAATPGSRGPERRGGGVRSSGRSRPSGSTRALGNARPHEGFELTSTIGIDFRQLLEGPHL